MSHLPWRNVLPVLINAEFDTTFMQRKNLFDMWAGNGLQVDTVDQPISTCYTREDWWARILPQLLDDPVIDVMGVAADYCVRDAVRGMLARGSRVNVLSSLTVGIKRQWQQVAREEFATELASGQLTAEVIHGI